MSRRWLGAALVVAVLATLAALWSTEARRASGREEERGAPRTDERSALVDPASPGTREARAEDAADLPAEPLVDGGAASAPPERPRGPVDVRVEEPDGRPAPDVEVELAAHPGPCLPELGWSDGRDHRSLARTDENGRATFAGVSAGPYTVTARSADGRRARRHVGHAGRASLDPVRLVLSGRPAGFLVRVVDALGPVPLAHVEIAGATRDAEVELAAVADARGHATFDELELHAAVVRAVAPDGREGMVRVGWGTAASWMQKGGLEVVVDAPGSLEGALVGLEAERLAGARVIAHALTAEHPHYAAYATHVETPVAGGRYRFERLAAGSWTLALVDPGGARLALPLLRFGSDVLANSVDPLEVAVAAGRTSVQDLEVAAGGVLEGRVLRTDGGPVAGAEVRVTYTPRTSNFPDGFYVHDVNVWRYDSDVRVEGKHPVSHTAARTGADGRYRLAGLFPGVQRVEVFAPGLAYDRREGVEVADGASVALEHVLAAAGAIQGREPASGYLGVTREGEERPRAIAILPASGSFAFPGLEPGRWVLSMFHSSADVEPVPLVTVEVAAGRTTWVDLSEMERPVELRGRVVGPDGPLAGARVKLNRDVVVTDGEGRFRAARSFPLGGAMSGPMVTVEHAGIETTLRVRAMAPHERSADWELVLGSEVVRLLVVDEHGSPAAAEVTLESSLETEREGITAVAMRRRVIDGQATLAGLVAGEFHATARFADGLEVQSSFAVPADEAVIRAVPSGELVVRALLADGRPAAGWRISSFTWAGEGPAPENADIFVSRSVLGEAPTDAEGRAVLRVAAGELLVELNEGRGWSRREGVGERLTLRSGERRELELRLPAPER